MTRNDPAAAWRVLLCHKHPVSARLHFLVPEQGGVLLPRALPRLAVVSESEQGPVVQSHPAMALRELQGMLGVNVDLEWVDAFHLHMETPGELVAIYLAALPGYDLVEPPPRTRWIQLPQSVGMPWLDREVLRRAYEVLIG
ncbi:hypothetical protein [Stutzerimonas tarimensis]|uniref:NUDIX hydrolase n=1 Tax=Stutzerimonas tarimensis TaxID=1507735 RepID=A0ABV7TAF2_9GAMM